FSSLAFFRSVAAIMPRHAHPNAYGAERHFEIGESEMSLETSEQKAATGTTSYKSRPELVRGLNVWHATSIVAGTIIGSGIFLVPAEMMQAVGSAGLVYLAWIVGGLLSFFGALTYSELGAMKPEAGGEAGLHCECHRRAGADIGNVSGILVPAKHRLHGGGHRHLRRTGGDRRGSADHRAELHRDPQSWGFPTA